MGYADDLDFDVGPFFDQEGPITTITAMLESMDISEPYEIDECAVFLCADGGYLVVWVSGCSCWPDLGGTTQEYCKTKADVDKALTGRYRDLLQQLQDSNWGLRNTEHKAE